MLCRPGFGRVNADSAEKFAFVDFAGYGWMCDAKSPTHFASHEKFPILDKGKPVARRGRKAMGSSRSTWGG